MAVYRSQFILTFIVFIFSSPIFAGGVCLSMIVKNEAPIIERCLKSVAPFVDCISICDTGSTDGTIVCIEEFLKNNHILGKIERHEWNNFGSNRTRALDAAKKTLEDLEFHLETSYILVLDADMVCCNIGFKKEELEADAYAIEECCQALNSSRVHLLRASLPWKCEGAVNEKWRCQLPFKKKILKTITIENRDDSSCKVGKVERDVQLALSDVENPAAVFHLGQIYKLMENNEEAIKWYLKRIDMGSTPEKHECLDEELWYAKYMVGLCYEKINEWEKAHHFYLDAFQTNPGRAEPLLQLAHHYRLSKNYSLAILFAQLGAKIPYPAEQNYCRSSACYDYRFDEELSIAAFYTPFSEEGLAATNRLILKKTVPWSVKGWSYQNLLFYVKNIPHLKLEPLLFDLPFVREGLATRCMPMNPSIQRVDEGYEVVCRAVNYIQIGAREFRSLDILDPSGTIRARNFFLTYDKDFNLVSQKEIIEDLEREKIPCYNSEGIEDCRLFHMRNHNWVTCTTCDTNPLGQREISLCQLDTHSRVKKLVRLKGPNPRRCEKNWLPFIKGDALHMIYSYSPFLVYQTDMEKGDCEAVCQYEPEYDFTHFRGSAAPIAFEQGYLVLIHEVVMFQNDRHYLHRFLYLDEELKIKKVSAPFTFLHKGVEYCCGMTLDHNQNNLILTIGIEDREAYFLTVDRTTIIQLLENYGSI